MTEYAVLNVAGFKIIKSNGGGKWTLDDNIGTATSPYVNPQRWWTGIFDRDIAYYISLKSKIDHWSKRKKSKDFNPEKLDNYIYQLNTLLSKTDECDILQKIASSENTSQFLPKELAAIFFYNFSN